MSRASDRYLRRVGKRLCASRQTKERLLGGLAAELSEAGDAGYDELVRTFGTPETAAAELQESVNEAEAAASRSKSRRIAIILGITCIILAVSLVAYIWYLVTGAPEVLKSEIIVDETIAPIIT